MLTVLELLDTRLYVLPDNEYYSDYQDHQKCKNAQHVV